MFYLLIFYALFSVGASFFTSVLYFSIQRGQIFGAWQNVLDKIYANEKIRPLGKPLGDCYFCFSHLIACLFFALYCLFANLRLDIWLTTKDMGLWLNIPLNIFFAYIFISGSILLSLKVKRDV